MSEPTGSSAAGSAAAGASAGSAQAASATIAPGDTIGILGGGQLGRMLALAAARLGLRSHIYAPEADSPAFDVTPLRTIADYGDEAALTRFARSVAVVTYEFENVPAEAVTILARHRPVRPNGRALETAQDRLLEKQFLRDLGLPTAAFFSVEDPGALARAVAQLGRPSLLKTRRFGYDGKGQALVREGSDLAVVFRSLGQKSILEGIVPFSREVSVVAARGLDGTFRAYDLCDNAHVGGILATTRLPAAVSAETEHRAASMAETIAGALDYVGILTVEMFLVRDAGGERLVINEIAPRVHNSGHWTLDGAATSQFEQHIRAICGWPLGATTRHGAIEMTNLIGVEAHHWRQLLGQPGLSLHLYGKTAARPGRKMGHTTRVIPPARPSVTAEDASPDVTAPSAEVDG